MMPWTRVANVYRFRQGYFLTNNKTNKKREFGLLIRVDH